ncbi:small acid-soluble spore protein K (minor) [Priestia megaterium]|jgi:small acid-soluble spore protein K (minor)|nr:Small, acid-soluble spore protein K [Priestia megaterium]
MYYIITATLSVVKGEVSMRNKAKDFPNQHHTKFEGEPRAKAEYASKRANGTINTHPQERMHASNEREE